MNEEKLKDLRKAAECHKHIRAKVRQSMKPGIKVLDICQTAEDEITKFFGENSIKCGVGFPVGVSCNRVAAHDSANPGDTRTIGKNDVVKIDCGVHVNGNIIDSAFTYAFDSKYDKLLEASKDGTWSGIKLAGPDARIQEISSAIQEAIESYEIELDQKVYPIKVIRNLGGHNIEPYKIHAGKIILGAPSKSVNDSTKMEVGELYAIETFATTGSGLIQEDLSMDCNHYMKNFDAPFVNLKLNTSKKILGHINKTRQTLPFASRWIEKEIGSGYKVGLSDLVKNKIVESFPPLVDIKNSYTSQLEHTLYIKENGSEVLSSGEDY